ncbi:UNVERIFIED_CONTAM: hypothetical protein RMT77_006797 [Armadillidium vulgare]
MEHTNPLLLLFTSLILPFLLHETEGRSLRRRREIFKIPDVVEGGDTKEPIDIFMGMWEGAGGKGSTTEACSVIIPADSSFALLLEPLLKDEIITELKKDVKNVKNIMTRAMSEDQFIRINGSEKFEGVSALEGATFGNPAMAKTSHFPGGKIMAWKSFKTKNLVVNGAPVLLQLGFKDDKCVVLITESFPFVRGINNNNYQYIINSIRSAHDMV